MNISIPMFNTLMDFLEKEDPDCAASLYETADAESDYVLEAMGIRGMEEVEIDPAIFAGKKEPLCAACEEALAAYDPALSYIDARECGSLDLVHAFFQQLSETAPDQRR
ncbi:hypothetical protein QO008_000895 [Peptoniphilus ivorii]|uniref:hypothetical protein n=1 Tax=Aedoeadaptatus ivorii TaxID=54006 RepID=UPI00278B7292|nr:hypothetical protein [Peptoniphilus ivorii]MDQ0508439.1 hypothetical protein [Peptoniphilus ivorii]